MADKKRLNVRRSIERLLLPALEARGFTRQVPAVENRLRPYGEFRRQGARGIDIVDIRFDKNRTSRFRVFLQTIPADWTAQRWQLPSEEWPEIFMPRRLLIFHSWYAPWKREGSEHSEAEFDAVAQDFLVRMPEVERFFQTGRGSHHMARTPGRFVLLRWTILLLVFAAPFLLLAWIVGLIIRNL